MTQSLPGAGSASRARRAERLRGAATQIGLKVMPLLPAGAKWLMAGGRAVTIDGNTLDRTVQVTLAGQRAMGVNGLMSADPISSRARMRQMCLALGGGPMNVAATELTLPGPAGEIAARHYRPVGRAPGPLLVFYHGGGFAIGDLDTHDALCRLTCRDASIPVLSIDYRLAPEHPAPAAVDDAFAAFAWAHAHAEELGGVAGQVAVGGDSAGGNLAAVVAQLARDAGGPAPVLQWLLYPVTDATAHTRSRTLFGDGFLLTKNDIDAFQTWYLTGSALPASDPRVSPLLADDLSGLAPALIATAGFDPLRDEGEQYAAALRTAGTPVDLRAMGSLCHGFANLFPLGGGSTTATVEQISALRAHLSRA